jgi:hypothetical protein
MRSIRPMKQPQRPYFLGTPGMVNYDIVIVKSDDGYRLLHGHLRLASVLSETDAVTVEVKGEGPVRVVKTRSGYLIGTEGKNVPLHGN